MSFGEWGEESTEADDVEQTPDAGNGGPDLVFGSVIEFYREYLRHTYARRITGTSTVWSSRWWKYDEPLQRIEALWRAWEHLRLDPATGLSVWFRDHADHHMRVLMDPDGAFAGSEERTKRGDSLPNEDPPAGLFSDVAKKMPS